MSVSLGREKGEIHNMERASTIRRGLFFLSLDVHFLPSPSLPFPSPSPSLLDSTYVPSGNIRIHSTEEPKKQELCILHSHISTPTKEKFSSQIRSPSPYPILSYLSIYRCIIHRDLVRYFLSETNRQTKQPHPA